MSWFADTLPVTDIEDITWRPTASVLCDHDYSAVFPEDPVEGN